VVLITDPDEIQFKLPKMIPTEAEEDSPKVI
jgi:hypothetical protein